MKKIKFPILLKVILAGILASFIAAGFSFGISYSNQIKSEIRALHTNINHAFDNLANYYGSETNITYLEAIKNHVRDGHDSDPYIRGYNRRVEEGKEYTLEDYLGDFEQFEHFYLMEDPYIYDIGFGLYPGKGEFQQKYVTLTNALLTAKITSGGIASYAAFIDENHPNRLVFIGDSRDTENRVNKTYSFYYLAGSYYQFTNNVPNGDTQSGQIIDFVINGKTTKAIPIVFDVSNPNDFVYVFIEYDDATAVAGVNSKIHSEIIILVIVTLAIILMYALLTYFLFVRNINKLSKASKDIKNKIEHNNLSELTEIKIKSKDEIADLATSLNALQTSVYKYADLAKKEAKEKEKINAELEVASKIQLEALPNGQYFDQNVKLQAFIKTAKEVGGDFYDYFYIDESRFVLLIADVSGKGIPAALYMMRSKATIKNEILSNSNLEEAIYKANNSLVNNNYENLFVTAFIGVVDLNKNEMSFINCGHEKPYIISKDKVNKLEGSSNFVLGEINDFKYKVEKVSFNKGDVLFMFTDGLNESINKTKEEFGYSRIEETLSKNKDASLENLITANKKALIKFIDKEEQFDDITMVAFSINNNELNLHFEKKNYEIIEEATNAFFDHFSYLDEVIKSHVGIAIDEMLNNLISYEKREDLKIDVSFAYKNKELKLIITSNGSDFDPFKHKVTKEEEELGGYGISLVKNISKKQSYKASKEKKIITIIF